MRARALTVPRAAGERTRRALADAGALREDLAIVEEEDRLVLPVRDEARVLPPWGKLGEREFPPLPPSGPSDFRELLPWPSAERAQVPRAFDVVGDVVLIRLPDSLLARRFEIGEALLRFVPSARIVGLDRGVRGPERRRSVERIAGSGGWATRHRENRLEFDVDVERAYFSPRLAGEHARVASEVRRGDRFYDLCCGVGPFAVTAARAGSARSVVAVDANPEAIALLRATLRRYPFGSLVRPLEARVEEFVRTAGPAERVLVNLPHEGIKYATLVAPLVAPGGRLYYYEVVPRDEIGRRAAVVENALASAGPFTVTTVRSVHPYSPASDLLALAVDRRGS